MNTSVKILLNVEEVIELDKNNRCINDINYDWTKCIMKEGLKFVGCSLNWFENDPDYPPCETVEQMKKMQEFFKSVKVVKFWLLIPLLGKTIQNTEN